jgi:hypothetical protein
VDGQIRMTVGCYDPEFRPGVIYPDGSYDPFTDPIYHVYKIVRGDSTSSDYLGWPVQQGAPTTPSDRPLLIGEQTLWCVYHDAAEAYHVAPEGGTPPLGLEVQQLAFAFDKRVAFGNVVFLEFKVINKLANTLDSTYIGIWSDPDIGGYADDLVGCDPSLDLGFAYNGANNDAVYGVQPPCVGYDLLRGPRGDGGTPRGMTAFRGYGNGLDPTDTQASYNFLKGLAGDGSPLTDPTTGNTTTFEMSGDPVSGAGWLDNSPGDRRFIIGSGPFTMAPGDTQEIALAIIVARGRGRIASVDLMKDFDRAAQAAYDAGFSGYFLSGSPGMYADAPAGGRRPDGKTPAEPNAAPRASAAARTGFLVSAGPSPALEGITVRFCEPSGSRVDIRILDSAGRSVRRLEGAWTAGAEATAHWDGRDDSNRRVPAGIYFIRAAGHTGTATAKVVLLR